MVGDVEGIESGRLGLGREIEPLAAVRERARLYAEPDRHLAACVQLVKTLRHAVEQRVADCRHLLEGAGEGVARQRDQRHP